MNSFIYPFFLLLFVACSPKSSIEEESDSKDETETIELELVSSEGLKMEDIVLPEGFKIDVYARVNNARSMVLTDNGTLFVANRNGDKVYAIQDNNGDWKADERYVIAEGLRMPNGVAFNNGDLYVAEVSKLLTY